jgi:hypothetical protein
MALLMGLLSAFLHAMSPPSGMAECEQYAEPLRELMSKAQARTLPSENLRFPPHTPRTPSCAVVTFTLTADGQPTKLKVLAASSEWMRRFALRVVRQGRYRAGEEEEVALILNTRFPDD